MLAARRQTPSSQVLPNKQLKSQRRGGLPIAKSWWRLRHITHLQQAPTSWAPMSCPELLANKCTLLDYKCSALPLQASLPEFGGTSCSRLGSRHCQTLAEPENIQESKSKCTTRSTWHANAWEACLHPRTWAHPACHLPTPRVAGAFSPQSTKTEVET